MKKAIGKFLCWIGWHKAPIAQRFDGASFEGKCPRCSKRVLEDSQGNWFEATIQ